MNWSVLTLKEFHCLKDCLVTDDLLGSDSALVSIFLLQKKYDTKTAIHYGFLFRYYTGAENRTGYGFPLKLCEKASDSQKEHTLADAVSSIIEDAKSHNRAVKFCLLTESQKNALDSVITAQFQNRAIEWRTNRDDCDYIYSREKLAALQGKTYHKKKNHVSRFLRNYEGNWEFRSLNLCSIADDMIFVAEKWLDERLEAAKNGEIALSDDEKSVLRLEHQMIKTALEKFYSV